MAESMMETDALANSTKSYTVLPAKKSRKRKQKVVVKNALTVDSAEPEAKRPTLPPVVIETASGKTSDMRKIPVPINRYTPLKEHWQELYTPVVEHLNLQIRFNLSTKHVEVRTTKETTEINALQKAADFFRAFTYGFEIPDALSLIRLDDLFLDSFDITDVKPLKGDHLHRAIGRLAGKGGRTKHKIENDSKTRIVIADTKIHILGSYQNIQTAKRAVCSLILGSQPAKVHGTMRALAARSSERF